MFDLLKKHFGYDSFRPLQQEIITRLLEHKDCLVLMPTGGGKSLCYQLPALILHGITIVISPLISLMKDQVDNLTENGIPAAFMNSTLSSRELIRIQQEALSGTVKILYLAPERVRVTGFDEFLRQLKIALFAIDEAHCISEWGHDFRPDYGNLKILRELFPSVPLVALTATATVPVRLDIIKQLDLREPKIFIGSFNRPNLTYSVSPKKHFAKNLLRLLDKYKDQSSILYCFSRKGAEELAENLRFKGCRASAYHAGLDPEIRKEIQEKFIKDKINIITATIAFGMGIDKPDVRLIAHCDLPRSVESYYQETGRAGRDGLPSECVLFFSYADRRKHAYFIEKIEDDAERRKSWKKLEEVLRYGNLGKCRRKYLLDYLGEKYNEKNCASCDVCSRHSPQFDATEVAQKILSAVVRTQQRFGAGYIARVLTGEKDERMERLGHHTLSVFGIIKDFKKGELISIIRELTALGLLRETQGEYPVIKLTSAGSAFLKQRQTVYLPKIIKGESFLSVIKDYAKSHRLEEIPRKIYNEPEGIVFGATYDKTIALLQKKLQPEEIAKQRGLSVNTIIDHIEKLSAQDKTFTIVHLRPPHDRLQTIASSFKKCGGWALSPVREDLGESYSYNELRLARIFIRKEKQPL